jgi:hypothetical protein
LVSTLGGGGAEAETPLRRAATAAGRQGPPPEGLHNPRIAVAHGHTAHTRTRGPWVIFSSRPPLISLPRHSISSSETQVASSSACLPAETVGSSSTPPQSHAPLRSLPSLPLHRYGASSEAGPEDGMARRAAAAARLLRRLGPLAAEPPMRGDLVWFDLIWGPRPVRCWLVGSGGVCVCA